MKKTSNVIVGAASVYVSKKNSLATDWAVASGANAGKVGVSLPTGTGSYNARLEASAEWRDVGFTTEGIEVVYEPDFGDVEVDQLLDSARLFKQSQRMMVNTTLQEATLENLLFVWGMPETTAGGATVYANGTGSVDGVTVAAGEEVLGLYAGGLGDEPLERSIAFVGPAPKAVDGIRRERVYNVYRALQVESTSHALRRNENTSFPASFRILPDPNRSGSDYGQIANRKVT